MDAYSNGNFGMSTTYSGYVDSDYSIVVYWRIKISFYSGEGFLSPSVCSHGHGKTPDVGSCFQRETMMVVHIHFIVFISRRLVLSNPTHHLLELDLLLYSISSMPTFKPISFSWLYTWVFQMHTHFCMCKDGIDGCDRNGHPIGIVTSTKMEHLGQDFTFLSCKGSCAQKTLPRVYCIYVYIYIYIYHTYV